MLQHPVYRITHSSWSFAFLLGDTLLQESPPLLLRTTEQCRLLRNFTALDALPRKTNCGVTGRPVSSSTLLLHCLIKAAGNAALDDAMFAGKDQLQFSCWLFGC